MIISPWPLGKACGARGIDQEREPGIARSGMSSLSSIPLTLKTAGHVSRCGGKVRFFYVEEFLCSTSGQLPKYRLEKPETKISNV